MIHFALALIVMQAISVVHAARLPPYLETQSAGSGRETLRISGDPGEPIAGIPGSRWGETVRHQYSKIGAWNCDQSLLYLLNRGGQPELVFLDGQTLKPVVIHQPEGLREVRWHPLLPEQMITVAANQVGLWNVRTGQRRLLGAVPEADVLGMGPWEGNVSDDGRHLVLAVGEPVRAVVPFDLQTGRAGEPLRHGFVVVDFATVSPSGRYIVVNGQPEPGQYDRTQVFDRSTGRAVGARWSEYGRPSHFDLTLDSDGQDIAVGVSKSKPDEGSLIARRLADGQITRLTSKGYAGHTSARNVAASPRDRVVASFAPNAEAWGPWSDTVLSVGTDRLDDLVVIGRMQAKVDDYWSQPQPTVSPDGRLVLWASNFGGSTIGSFLARPSASERPRERTDAATSAFCGAPQRIR